MKIHRKKTLSKFMRRWQFEYGETCFENENYLKALKFHESLMKVKLKLILQRIKRVIKEEKRFISVSKV